jgi:hypothetical protein
MQQMFWLVPHKNVTGRLTRLNDTVKDERKENITFSFSDLFKLCSKDRKVISCSEYVVPKVTQWGLCYTFNSYEHNPHCVTLGTTYNIIPITGDHFPVFWTKFKEIRKWKRNIFFSLILHCIIQTGTRISEKHFI